MNDKFIARIVRSLIVVIMFIPLVDIQGMDLRSAQHSALFLAVIVLFGLLLRNIWLTAFVAWTVFTFSYYNFQCGGLYVYNVLIGAILYYCVKISFKKEHINLLFNAFLWLVVANLGLMFVQQCGLDFVFKVILRTKEGIQGYIDIVEPCGFMALKAAMGMLMALAVPILLTRWNKWSTIGTALLFVPIYISKSSICMGGAIIGVLFVLWYKDLSFKRLKSKWVWSILLIALIVVGLAYIVLIDAPMGTLPTRLTQWRITLKDCVIHPISGWGLDSFRNELPWKKFVYAMNMSQAPSGAIHYDFWDNAHNLYIQVMYEWGLIGILILVGYLRGCFLKFNKAIKSSNTVALGGFLIVLLIINIAQFPLFLSRCACFIIPIMALFDTQMSTEE